MYIFYIRKMIHFERTKVVCSSKRVSSLAIVNVILYTSVEKGNNKIIIKTSFTHP